MELQKRYNELKKEYESELGEETLRKFRILNEAYEIGKKLKKRQFSLKLFAEEFETPYTTVKRILSLRYASKFQWTMIDEGKISAFKVAQICMKTKCYKDELTKMSVKGNLSTCDIKKINVSSLADLKKFKKDVKENHEFTRASSAYRSFCNTSYKLKILLAMPLDSYPEDKRKEVINKLKDLEIKIKKYID